MDGGGNIWLTGNTFSPTFPTTAGSLQPTCPVDTATNSCYYHTFVTKIAAGGGSLVFSTFLGSSEKDGQEIAKGIVVDALGNGYVTGFTNSEQFPVKDTLQANRGGGFCLGLSERRCFDAYVTAFRPNGSLLYSTYLGGSSDEYTGGIALDNARNVYVTGYTSSLRFPVTNDAFQGQKDGSDDFFVAKLSAGNGPPPPLPNKVYVPLIQR